ncbi:hypothetical protein P171DRAFT_447808 [Karstenula rhodostoma CBS 690.94]|uniref:Uncharacterized protein n=1 Tax=Karstenula rhodostoma CBS 690.94 TaxID=1392251 RepID=A0A9P4P7H2_9PLEO|nr:hypothetical protein P171DRAFT_447808 [Karstenula rhodostoma CBS 690.94]
MVANIFSRRRTNLTTESSTTLSIKPRIERQKGIMRVSAMSLQCNMQRIQKKVLPEPPRPRAVFQFLNLPRKIRHTIYAYYLALTVPPQLHVDSLQPTSLVSLPGPLPSLCYANRKIHAECTPRVFLDTELVLPNVLAVQRLTHYLSPPTRVLSLPTVHTLVFSPAISWRPHLTHTTKALLAACPALRHVKIGVPPTVCVRTEWAMDEEKGSGYTDMCVPRMRLKKEVVEEMDLCCLIDCEALESVTLVCWEGEAVARSMGSRREVVFMPLIVWVRKNVCARGRLRLVVEYVG